MRLRFFDYYLGVDVGVTKDPSAIAVLQRLNASPDENVPDDLTDQVPILEVADLAGGKAIPFPAIAREVRRITTVLDGTYIIGVDSTGAGSGVVQELRRLGVPCIGFQFGGGSRVIPRGDSWSAPATVMYETPYQLLVQSRLKLHPHHDLTKRLTDEMEAVETEMLPSGNVRYDVRLPGSHGDLLAAVGIAATLHEYVYQGQVARENRTTRRQARERWSSGRRHNPNVARQVIEARLQATKDAWDRQALEQEDRFRRHGYGTIVTDD